MNSEENKNMVSVKLWQQLGVSGLQDTYKLQQSSMEAFYGFILYFKFEPWSPFTTTVWNMTATPLSCETPAVFVTKKLHLTFHLHEGG